MIPTFVAGGKHVGDNDQSSTLSFGLPLIALGAFHTGMFLPSLHLLLEVNNSPVSYGNEFLFSADDVRKDERHRGALLQALEVMTAEYALVAHDRHVDDNDQNSTLWFGLPEVALGVFHTGICLIFEMKSLPASGASGVCVQWKDEVNGAVRLAAQEAGRGQELSPMAVGKEQEEREALMWQQIADGIAEWRHSSQQVKLVPVVQPRLTFGVLEAFDGAEQPFATFPSNGRCKRHCVMRAWD